MAYAELGHYFDEITDIHGETFRNTHVPVYLAGTNTPAVVYAGADLTGPTSAPQTDSYGNLAFWAVPAYYDIEVNGVRRMVSVYPSLHELDGLVGLAAIYVSRVDLDWLGEALATEVNRATAMAPLGRYKAADTYRDSATPGIGTGTTGIADPHLTVPVAANAVYDVRGDLIVDATTAADFRAAWTLPSGATMNNWHLFGVPTTASSGTSTGVFDDIATAASYGFVGGLGLGTLHHARIAGLLIVGATGGNCVLKWAQNTPDATANSTGLKAGSRIILDRIA